MIELYTCLNYFNTAMKNASQWLREEKVSTGLQITKRAWVKQKPFGVVAVISPWNYPLVLMLNPVLGALIAGNVVVVKPSEYTPATAAFIETLFKRVPELKPYIRFVYGDGQTGAALVSAPPDMIFVTGSVRTGQLISKAASETLIPVVCELGGKDPMLVLEDADIEAAARWGTWGAFTNSGQTCMAPERVYVVEAVYDDFLKAVLEEIAGFRVGYSLDENSSYHYGAISFPHQLQIIVEQLRDAVEKGASILRGGSHDGVFFQPTIIIGVDSSMRLLQEETFGAIMPIIKVKDEAEAIAMANDSPYGLSASIFSEDLSRAKRIAEELEVGSVNINDTISHYGIAEMPFGGVKASGYGRSNGREGLRAFTYSAGYVYGKPRSWDIATKLREPGNYRRTKATMFATLAPTWRQKLAGLWALLYPDHRSEGMSTIRGNSDETDH